MTRSIRIKVSEADRKALARTNGIVAASRPQHAAIKAICLAWDRKAARRRRWLWWWR